MGARFTVFMAQGDQSWTESHMRSDVTDPTAGGTATLANDLCRRRANLLGPGAEVFACRVSIIGDPGNSEDIDIGVGYNSPYAGAGANNAAVDSEIPNDCIMLSATGKIGDKTYRKKVYLASPPDGCVKTRNGFKVFEPTPRFNTDLQVYQQYLQTGWSFPVKVASNVQVVDSLGMQQAAPGLLTVIAPGMDAGGFAPGKKVHLRGFRVHPTTRKRLAGVWKVQSRTGPVAGLYTLALLGTQGHDPTAYIDGGTIEAAADGLCTYKSWGESEGTTRDRGFAGSRPRGRARTRA